MSFTDLLTSRLTFGVRFNDPNGVTTANQTAWISSQLSAPSADDPSVLTRLAAVMLPMTVTASDGTSTTVSLPLFELFLSPAAQWAIPAGDTSANHANSRRATDEVSAARLIRAAFSPWQLQEVMVDLWHNHFSVDAYQSGTIEANWPTYDTILRTNALGNFRTLLGATAKSVAMMVFLNQNASVAAQPNENYAREVMELHTLGIQRYLGETTPAGAVGTGYSDQDVTNAARVLTGWTIADGHQKAADGSMPNDGSFLFNPHTHDTKAKVIFGQSFPAGQGEAEGERFLDMLAAHPGTAQTIATKLYLHFVGDTPAANDPLIATLAAAFTANAKAPNQIALVLQALINSPQFAASAGQKVKTPFEFVMSLMRASGAEIDPESLVSGMLSSMGQPLFDWPTPNGMPDTAPTWTGTNDMIRRWTLANQVTAVGTGLLLDGVQTLFAAAAPQATSVNAAVTAIVTPVLGTSLSPTSLAALLTYAGSQDALGASGAMTNPTKRDAALRSILGALAATPEFQWR